MRPRRDLLSQHPYTSNQSQLSSAPTRGLGLIQLPGPSTSCQPRQGLMLGPQTDGGGRRWTRTINLRVRTPPLCPVELCALSFIRRRCLLLLLKFVYLFQELPELTTHLRAHTRQRPQPIRHRCLLAHCVLNLLIEAIFGMVVVWPTSQPQATLVAA